MENVSLAVITLNAEKTLDQMLKPFDWIDDIIIVDSGSTDRTEEIAKKHNACFVNQPFLGFGKQKQLVTQLAKHGWILNLDSDEIVSVELLNFLKQIKYLSNEQISAYSFPVMNIFLNKEMKFWGWQNERKIRLFRRDLCRFSDDNVHESVLTSSSVQKTDLFIKNHSYDSIDDYFYKFNKYTTAAAKDLKSRNKKIPTLVAFFKMIYKFFSLYFFKGGFCLGWHGFIWSIFSSFYVFVKYIKLEELLMMINDA